MSYVTIEIETTNAERGNTFVRKESVSKATGCLVLHRMMNIISPAASPMKPGKATVSVHYVSVDRLVEVDEVRSPDGPEFGPGCFTQAYTDYLEVSRIARTGF